MRRDRNYPRAADLRISACTAHNLSIKRHNTNTKAPRVSSYTSRNTPLSAPPLQCPSLWKKYLNERVSINHYSVHKRVVLSSHGPSKKSQSARADALLRAFQLYCGQFRLASTYICVRTTPGRECKCTHAGIYSAPCRGKLWLRTKKGTNRGRWIRPGESARTSRSSYR